MRGVKRGKGLGLKYVALKKERPVAQLLSLLSQDGKKNNTWPPDGQTESFLPLCSFKPRLFTPSWGNYGAQSQEGRLATASKG